MQLPTAVGIAIQQSGGNRGRGLFALTRFGLGDLVHMERPQIALLHHGPPLTNHHRPCPDCGIQHDNAKSICDEHFGSKATRLWFNGVVWKSSPRYPTAAARLLLKRLLSGIPPSPDWLSKLQGAGLIDHIPEVRHDWRTFLDVVRPHIRSASWPISALFPYETFARALAVVHLNAIKVGGGGDIALPEILGLVNHSCDPNVQVDECLHDGRLRAMAVKDIEPGDELRLAYIDPTLPWEQRRSHLLRNYGFECDCWRCAGRL